MAAGCFRLGIVLASLVVASGRLQRRLAPRWSGATAVLARCVVGLALLLGVAQLLGAFGQFRPWALTLGVALACGLVGVVVGPGARSTPPPGPTDEAAPPMRWTTGPLAAVAVTGATVVTWVVLAWWIGRHGVADNDSLRYHGPFVARWLQTHSLTQLHYTSGELQEVFFPANSELVAGIGAALLGGRDWLTPLLNLGWMALALLAGWTVADGRRRPYTMGATAIVLTSPMLLRTQPGTARNDLAAAALVLAAVALVLRWRARSEGGEAGERSDGGKGGDRRLAPLVIPACAAGMAVGSKLSVVVPAVVLGVWVVATSRRGRRLVTAAIWAGPFLLTGAFWYLRNWVRVGNPLPWYSLHLGPIRLPSPQFQVVELDGGRISDQLGSGTFWRHWVPYGLGEAAGRLWPAAVVIGMAALGVGLVRAGRHRLLCVMAGAALLVDVVTPYSAGGRGAPTMFPGQLRFLTVEAILVLLAAVLLLPEQWLERRSAVVVAVPVAVAVVGLLQTRPWVLDLWVTTAAAGFGALVWWRQRSAIPASPPVPTAARARPRALVRTGALAAGVLLCTTFSIDFASHRYAAEEPGAAAAFEYFRHVHDARIAVGVLGHTYPLAGEDLSNYVQMVGLPAPDSGFTLARSCSEWQRVLAGGRFDYVTIGRAHSWRGAPLRQRNWTARIPGAREVVRSGTTSVFRLPSRITPTCPDRLSGGPE